VITDSKYVFDNYNRAVGWSQNGWRNQHGRPVENKDLWKEMLSIRRSLRVRVDVQWTKGKKSTILKAVDRSAKSAAAAPARTDRGFRPGKIGRSRNSTGQAAKMFPAAGQEIVIRV
jgi:ribonuclease HI